MARQKLITQEILKNTPKLMEQEGLWGEAIAYAKFFTPNGGWAWYMTEYDPITQEAFGYVEGLDKEVGPFSIKELEEINDKFFNNPYPSLKDKWIVRDQYFKPAKLKEINPDKFEDKEFSEDLEEYKKYIKEYFIDYEGISNGQLNHLCREAEKNPFKLFNDLCDNNGVVCQDASISQGEVVVNPEMFVCFDEFKETILKQLKNSDIKLTKGIEKLEKEILVKNWYMKNFAEDELGGHIDPNLDWAGLQEGLEKGQDIYEVLGVGDGVVRERVFSELADRLSVDYTAVYNQWLKKAPGKIKSEENFVCIFQLPNTNENLNKIFRGYSTLEEKGIKLELKDYKKVYTYKPLRMREDIREDLNDFYLIFQNEPELAFTPKDYKNRAVSVSDLFFIHKNGEDKLFYVDSFGFKELPEFVDEAKLLIQNKETNKNPKHNPVASSKQVASGDVGHTQVQDRQK